jgi:hypothetical protein
VRGIAATALVCIGIVVMACALGPLQWALLLSVPQSGDGVALVSRILVWVPVLMAVAIGFWLIRKRHVLASRWFDDSQSPIGSDPRALLRLAVLVVGVVLIARAIPSLVAGITSGVETSTESSSLDASVQTQVLWLWTRALTSSAGPAVELAAGALLLAYSTRLVNRLWGPRGPSASAQSAAPSTDAESAEAVDHPDNASA